MRNYLKEITDSRKARAPAVILYGVPGLGKTSFAASIPDVCFMIDDSERGIDTLKASGCVPRSIKTLPPYSDWQGVLDTLDQFAEQEHDFKWLAIDTLGGLERLCHEHVCGRNFDGDWSEKGFLSFHRGYEVALADWRGLLKRLDRVRDRGIRLICLAHSTVKPFHNPAGDDYDRYFPDMHPKTWTLTAKWADIIMFGNFLVTVEEGKGAGGHHRVLYTEYTAAWEAKNRHGLPFEISMGRSGPHAWKNFCDAFPKREEN